MLDFTVGDTEPNFVEAVSFNPPAQATQITPVKDGQPPMVGATTSTAASVTLFAGDIATFLNVFTSVLSGTVLTKGTVELPAASYVFQQPVIESLTLSGLVPTVTFAGDYTVTVPTP